MATIQEFLDHLGLNDTEKKLEHASTGNTTAAIMAVPKIMDPIRLIGDEEKHATLLYFGESSKLPEDAKSNLLNLLFLASKVVSPFRESIISIERLGEETPPALVAKLSNSCLGKIRDTIQLNPNVGEYLKNATQYPSFTPHVTFGYPDYKDEAGIRELAKKIYRIEFDSLQLWWNDERYAFDLSVYPLSDVEDSVAYSDEDLAFLEHFGVRGMHWGVRRTDAQLARAAGTKQPAAEDAIKAVTSAQKVRSAGSLNVLSSGELQQLVSRMRLEQDYIKLTTPVNQPTVQKGEGFVKSFLKTEAKTFQKTGAASAGVLLLAKLLDQKSQAAPEYIKTAGKHALRKEK